MGTFVRELEVLGTSPCTIKFRGGNEQYADMLFFTPIAKVEARGIEINDLDVEICYNGTRVSCQRRFLWYVRLIER